MSNIAYDEKLEEFRAQLRSKEKERDDQIARYNKEIAALARIVETLTKLLKPLAGSNPVSARELDNKILSVFSDEPEVKITRKALLKKLLARGVDLSGFTNRMSYIHASLGRLHKNGILNRETADIAGSTKKKSIYSLRAK